MTEPLWMSGDFTGFDEKSIRHLKEIRKTNEKLWSDERAVFNALYTELYPFIPNWKRLRLSSKEEGLKHIKSQLKKEEEHLAERGYGETEIKDGTLTPILALKGKKIKRQKQFVH